MSSKRRGSYIVTQLDSINLRLTNLFDEIGLNTAEREDRERKVYSVISDALESYVTEIKAEREEVKTKCINTRKQVQSMIKSLKDVDMTLLLGPKLREILLPREEDIDSEEYIPQPYLETLNSLNVAFTQIQNIYVERSNLANKLFGDLTELSEKLKGIEISPELSPPSTSKGDIEINLSTNYLSQLENEVQRWRNELQSRISKISLASVQIVNLYAELGTPQTEIDGSIMSHYKDSPELIGTGKLDVERVERTLQSLLDEKRQREEKISNLSEQVFKLWKKLEEDETYISNFEKSNRGLGLNVLHAYEKEYERLMEKKRQHIGVFIQDARSTLEDLWDKLYFSEEETLQFTPAWSDVVTDASLEAHEAEIARLEKLLEERQPIIQLIDQYKELQNEEQELQSSTQDASRLLQRGRRDPTRLLREEQMRKRIAKKKPRVMQELKAGLDEWQKRNGKPFYINGEDFGKILEQELAKTSAGRKVPSRLGISASSSSKPAPTSSTTSNAPSARAPMRAVSSASTASSRFAAPTPRSFSRAGPTTSTTTTTTSTISRAQNNRSPTRGLANTPLTARSTPLSSNLLKPHPRLSPTKTNTLSSTRTVSSNLNNQTPAMLPRARTALGTHSRLGTQAPASGRVDMRLNGNRAGNESPIRQDRITSQSTVSSLSSNRPLMRPGTSLGLRTPPSVNLQSSLQRSPEQSPLRRPISLLAPSRMGEQNRLENVDAGNDSTISSSISHSRSRSELGHYNPEEMSPHRRQLLLLQRQQQNQQNTLNRLSELSLGSPSSHSTMIMQVDPYTGSQSSASSTINNQGNNNSLSIFGSNKENGFNLSKSNLDSEENLSGDTVVYNKKPTNTSTPAVHQQHFHHGNYSNGGMNSGSSENWQAFEDTSMNSEFDDPLYSRWRQNALQKLANGTGINQQQQMTPIHSRQDRLSDFNWEKDTF